MSAHLVFRPVTHETQADFEALFSARGSPSYCWCMAWRATSQELRDAKGPARRQQMLGRIAAGTPVGLLAYRDGTPVGWVSVAPKAIFRGLGGPLPEPNEQAWSLTCMFVPRPLRGQGLAHELIAAAIAHAHSGGATVLEAYPVDPDSPSYRFMGFVPAFEAAGFAHAGMAGTRRHVMRLAL
ncbi:GNAT family N-acetyltransferase [Devosia nitrariae]|uniref:N-acetyltransferase n=1 Tax=Devosia nitrariae TaxID=2071872 RepID=A0ABQ5W2B0_9HYPH|nr:GNAT family N-acetyltransferase [Devosia nitrariae]GLQ54215.1 N-acetyltransferase [Devosia nitrariae]